MKFSKLVRSLILVAAVTILFMAITAADGSSPDAPFYGRAWALFPPVIAITLAFATKEVYSSLFLGVLAGALLYAQFDVLGTLAHLVEVIGGSLGDNGGILIFLVALGIIVALMERSGCSAAYARWVATKIKTKTGALLSTTVLGIMLFVDDYFNCLTTGNVMRPVTDQHQVSRARLAYNIDCTAAPICIIAPVSSWAAAVAGYIPDEYAGSIDGFMLFVQQIPFNFYALLTIVMLVSLALLKFDFGPMARYERMAEEEGDIYGGTGNLYADAGTLEDNPRAKVSDMVLPIVVLIVSCVVGLLYSGGFFAGGVSVVDAFANCDAFLGLPIGGIIALFFTVAWYLGRGIVSTEVFVDSIPKGFVLMVPAILILTFSWSLETVCNDSLGATQFVQAFMANSSFPLMILPFILYILGTLISFATGTAWGTFGILIPIVLAIFGGEVDTLCLISISAALAGAVTGDHCSPISETAIMSSTAAQVDFMQHVMTQLPYAGFVAVMSGIGFLLAGFIQNALICLPLVIVLMVVTLVVIRKVGAKRGFVYVRQS